MKTALELHEKWKLLWMKVDDYESMLKVVCHYLSGDWLPHNWAQHLLLEVRNSYKRCSITTKMFNYNENLQSQWRRSITMSRLLVSDANSGLWCGSHRTTSWIHSASSSSCSGERWVPYYIILLPEFPFGPGCSSGNFWTAGQSRVWQAWPAELGCDHHCRHWALDLHQVWVRGKSQTFWLLFLYQMGDDHEALTKAHCSMVGAWCRPPAGLHCRQILPAQTQPCAAAWEGAHQGWVTPG